MGARVLRWRACPRLKSQRRALSIGQSLGRLSHEEYNPDRSGRWGFQAVKGNGERKGAQPLPGIRKGLLQTMGGERGLSMWFLKRPEGRGDWDIDSSEHRFHTRSFKS